MQSATAATATATPHDRTRLPRPPAWWFDGAAPPLHARALATLYGGATAVRRNAFRRGWAPSRHPGIPVIVVGNIVAGGSGKTPLVIALVERLRAVGWTPGVASRGHGRDDPAKARWVDADSRASQVGDEPLLIARRTARSARRPRPRCRRRRTGTAGCNVVVCDDGLQHYRLARDIEIEVQDARRRYGNGSLPAGPCASRSSAPQIAVSACSTSARRGHPKRSTRASANGRCSWWPMPPTRCTGGAGSRYRRLPASACMPWPG